MEPALIAIVGAIVGVLFTNGIKLVLDARGRAERVRDIQTALRAEIRSHRHAFELLGAEEDWRPVVEEVAAGGFLPFTLKKPPAFVFDAIVGEVHILPVSVVDPVVLYYGQYATVRTGIDVLNSIDFKELASERSAGLFEDYFRISSYALQLASEAIEAIDSALSRGEIQ
jgi:hypothetical protein